MNRPLAPVVARITPAASMPRQFAMMPWYPRDFASSTRGWPLTAKAIYHELLDIQWDQSGLPAESAELRTLVGATPAEWKHWPKVEPKFPLCADGLRRNARLEAHRSRALDRSNKASDAAHEKWRKDALRRASDANA